MCNIAAMLPDGQVLHTEAVMEGLIAGEPAGEGGFGYDPILYLPEFGKTSAEITMDRRMKSATGEGIKGMKEAWKVCLSKRWRGRRMRILIVSDTHRRMKI